MDTKFFDNINMFFIFFDFNFTLKYKIIKK